jgi:ribosomal protein S21
MKKLNRQQIRRGKPEKTTARAALEINMAHIADNPIVIVDREDLDGALRRLGRKVGASKIFVKLQDRRKYLKPSDIKRQKWYRSERRRRKRAARYG